MDVSLTRIAIMTNTTLSRADLATQSATLRAELKQWEKTFAEANRGRKAGRGDIKKDPAIGNSQQPHPVLSRPLRMP